MGALGKNGNWKKLSTKETKVLPKEHLGFAR